MNKAKPGSGFSFCNYPGFEWGGTVSPATGCPKLKPYVFGNSENDDRSKLGVHGGCQTPDGEEYCWFQSLCNQYPMAIHPGYEEHPRRLRELITKDPMIQCLFCSGDVWAWPREKTEGILRKTAEKIEKSKNFFLFLTRNPRGYSPKIIDHPRIGYGTTVTNRDDAVRTVNLRAQGMEKSIYWVIIEPCFLIFEDVKNLELTRMNWVIIGAVTGIKDAWRYCPTVEVVKAIIEKARNAGAAVYLKPNLTKQWNKEEWKRWGEESYSQEWPAQIHEWAKEVRQ